MCGNKSVINELIEAYCNFSDNISYIVKGKYDVESLVQTIVDGIKKDCIISLYPKTMIYVHIYPNCSDSYKSEGRLDRYQ